MSQPRSPSSPSSSSESKQEPGSPNSPSAGSVAPAPEITWSGDKVNVHQFATSDPKKEGAEYKPLVAFNYISEMLTSGLVGLTLNFLEDKEKKNAEKIMADMFREIIQQGDAGGKFNGEYYSRTGGILALSSVSWIQSNEQDILHRFGIANPPTDPKDNVDTYFRKNQVVDLIHKNVQPKYQAGLLKIVDLVYALVNFSTIPANVRDFGENTKNPKDPEKKLFNGSDETMNSIIGLVNNSVTELLALKDKTKKMDQINQAVTRLNKGIEKISMALKTHEQIKAKREIATYQKEIETLRQQTADTATVRAELAEKMKEKEEFIEVRERAYSSDLKAITAVNEHLATENALLKEQIIAVSQGEKKEEHREGKQETPGEDASATEQFDTDMLLAENASLKEQYEMLVSRKAESAAAMGEMLNEQKQNGQRNIFQVDRDFLDKVSTSVKEYYATNPGKVDKARRAPKLELLLEKTETAVKLGDENKYKENYRELKSYIYGLMKGETYGTFHFLGKHDKGLDSILEKHLGKDSDENEPGSSPSHRM